MKTRTRRDTLFIAGILVFTVLCLVLREIFKYGAVMSRLAAIHFQGTFALEVVHALRT